MEVITKLVGSDLLTYGLYALSAVLALSTEPVKPIEFLKSLWAKAKAILPTKAPATVVAAPAEAAMQCQRACLLAIRHRAAEIVDPEERSTALVVCDHVDSLVLRLAQRRTA